MAKIYSTKKFKLKTSLGLSYWQFYAKVGTIGSLHKNWNWLCKKLTTICWIWILLWSEIFLLKINQHGQGPCVLREQGQGVLLPRESEPGLPQLQVHRHRRIWWSKTISSIIWVVTILHRRIWWSKTISSITGVSNLRKGYM